MSIENIVDRYYELRSLLTHPQYILDEEEMEEYNEICSDLLLRILKDNRDILIRLRDR